MDADQPRLEPSATVAPMVPVDRRVTFTRTRATAVTFSWRVRLLLSVLPALPLIVFMWGGLGMGPLTWLFGLMTVVAAALWLPHVWTSAPIAAASPPGQDPVLSADQRGSVPNPADLFTWLPPAEPGDGERE